MSHHVWFTADPHFGHANMCQGGPHPFPKARPFKTIQAMDAALIANWNALIAPADEVYVVGDFCLGGLEQASSYFAQLNGCIYVIPGSHDERWAKPLRTKKVAAHQLPFSKSGLIVNLLPELVTIRLPGYKVDGRTLSLTMCHYQMASWEQSHHGTLHIFGHHHGQRKGIGRSMDVGVDTNRYAPYALVDVVNQLLPKPIHGKYQVEVQFNE